VRNLASFSFAVLSALVFPAAFLGQTVPCLNGEKYDLGGGLCIESKPLVLNRVWGRVVRLDMGGHVWTDVRCVCLSLFTADSHKFVATATVDQTGRFHFGAVTPGRYRLVARAPALPTGNGAVTVVRFPWHRDRRIVVSFTCCNVDACTGIGYDHQ
jgi:hypothetical protein